MLKLLFLFFASLLLSSCTQKQEIPDIRVRDLEGKELSLTSLKGKPILLYVWSKTCAGHSKDLNRLNDLAKKHPNYWIVSYAVAMEPKDVKESYKELGIGPKFVTLIDTPIKFNDFYPLTYLPSSYFFDKKGVLERSSYGLLEDL